MSTSKLRLRASVHRTRAAGCNFTEILIRPRLTVPSDGQRETGLSLLRRTKSVCMISRAITIPQTLEALVETGESSRRGLGQRGRYRKTGSLTAALQTQKGVSMMFSYRLVRLIESHADALAAGLEEKVQASCLVAHFREIPGS